MGLVGGRKAFAQTLVLPPGPSGRRCTRQTLWAAGPAASHKGSVPGALAFSARVRSLGMEATVRGLVDTACHG